MIGFHPVRRRIGVTHSVMIRKRMAQSPVVSVMKSIGFAVSLPVNASNTSVAAGMSAATKMIRLRTTMRVKSFS